MEVILELSTRQVNSNCKVGDVLRVLPLERSLMIVIPCAFNLPSCKFGRRAKSTVMGIGSLV